MEGLYAIAAVTIESKSCVQTPEIRDPATAYYTDYQVQDWQRSIDRRDEAGMSALSTAKD